MYSLKILSFLLTNNKKGGKIKCQAYLNCSNELKTKYCFYFVNFKVLTTLYSLKVCQSINITINVSY